MTRSPEKIEDRLEETRERLGANLGELGERMSPGNIVDEAMRYFDTGPKEFAGTLGNQVRQNPLGTLVTAAGLAWLAFGRDRSALSRHDRGPGYDRENSALQLSEGCGSYDPQTGTESYDAFDNDYSDPDMYDRDETYRRDVDTYRSDIDTYSAIESSRSTTSRSEGENDGDYYRRLDESYAERLNITREDGEDDTSFSARIRAGVDAAKDRATGARQALGRSAQDARYRLGAMGDRASQHARQAKRKAADFHEENPLVSGVLALAVGALAGSLFPVSEQERQALQPVADDLIERGADLAQQGADRVETHAQQVEDKADELASTKPSVSAG